MKKNRPLSPHLTIYKQQITSIVSIFHRISGSTLALSIILFAFFYNIDIIFGNFFLVYHLTFNLKTYTYWFFISLLYFLVVIFCFHFCNGIRHLIWDLGIGLDIKNVYNTGFVVLTITIFILLAILL